MPQTIVVGDNVAGAVAAVASQLDVQPTALLNHLLCSYLMDVYGELLDADTKKRLRGRVAGSEGQYGNLSTYKQRAMGQGELRID